MSKLSMHLIIVNSGHKCRRDRDNDNGESLSIGHFTVVCSVTKPMNFYEAAGDLALIQTLLLLSCKLCCCNAN